MCSSHSKEDSTISMASLTLLIMLKVPGAIEVKSRLAQSIGVEHALNAYRWMVGKFLLNLPEESFRAIYYTPAEAEMKIQQWLGDQYTYYRQVEGDLGNRFMAACEESFARGAKSVVLMGGDCPYINQSVIAAVVEGLKKNDIVIGPTFDGGYYLLACKRHMPALFQDISWSTESVFIETLERIKTLGLSVFILKPLEDVDDLKSWRRAEAYFKDEAE